MATAKIDPIKLYNVPYEAMEPTIARGTEVRADRAYYFRRAPTRWQVVVFLAPEVSKLGSDLGLKPIAERGKCTVLINAAAKMYEKDGEIYRPQIYYVKRIVGLPGETIQFTADGIKIDGAIIAPPSHLKTQFSSFRKRAKQKYGIDPYQIPDDSVFVLGDNTAIEVVDSRECGPIPLGNLEAKVLDVR
jgi:signal peptidase I